ncbi:MAG TPA: hypothetical protein VFB16_02165 [Bauldia sp.]|nr:hypothetical protein [Bauldia sp.]
MKRTYLLLASALLFVAPAYAAGGVGAALQSAAEATNNKNVGGFISGTIYGNTSNPSGKGNGVLPSESPGPWAHGTPGDGPTLPGGSMGDFISPATSNGNSNSNFANDKNPGPDFVK